MLHIVNLVMSYGFKVLFQDVNINLIAKNHYGVTGPNGAGKSTLLKLLAGEEQPTAGIITLPEKMNVGLLKQDHYRYESDRIIDVVIKGKAILWNALSEKWKILENKELTAEQGVHLAELEVIIHDNDGYTAESRAQLILTGLGIADFFHYQPLSVLSGGYKFRVLLAQLLFQAPDVMLLDEPTNHLDIVTIAWLEKFLKIEFNGLLIFVSHDHDFLNNMATHILDIDYGTITQYTGNFEQSMCAKKEVLAQKQHELKHKQVYIKEMQEYADRFRANPSRAKQALSRLKMIERVKLPDIVDSSRIKPIFKFKCRRPSGKNVLVVDNANKAFDGKSVFSNVSFELQRGQKCIIIGPNGIGKSTLLKVLMGQLKLDSGAFQWNETVDIAYFAQNFRVNLPENKTLLGWFEDAEDVSASVVEIRRVLGKMLFTGQSVDQRIGSLSGGEATRLLFAKIMLQQPNVLVLDEPTNHLSLEAIDALGEALHQFEGTVILVSHNRYFVNAVAERILVIGHDRIIDYLGNYSELIQWCGADYLQALSPNSNHARKCL